MDESESARSSICFAGAWRLAPGYRLEREDSKRKQWPICYIQDGVRSLEMIYRMSGDTGSQHDSQWEPARMANEAERLDMTGRNSELFPQTPYST